MAASSARFGDVRTRFSRLPLVYSMTYARRPRSLAAALTLVAATLAVAPLRSPAATNAVSYVAAKPVAAKKKPTPAKPAGYHPNYGPAPADEYFGRLGMSILGVRNKVKDLGLDADIHPDHGNAVLSNALWVEDAMRDWAKRYPFDHWLPRFAFALEQMYEEIPGNEAHKRAVKQLGYITAYFPQTVYGRVGRAKLAYGVPITNVARPNQPVVVKTDLQRLALLDGKVIPTVPPVPAPPPMPSPLPSFNP
jgi:hypothetical protein